MLRIIVNTIHCHQGMNEASDGTLTLSNGESSAVVSPPTRGLLHVVLQRWKQGETTRCSEQERFGHVRYICLLGSVAICGCVRWCVAAMMMMMMR